MAEYRLMHRKVHVADIELSANARKLKIARILEPAHLPVGTVETNGNSNSEKLEHWWKSRTIPASRTGLEMILEQLKMETAEALAEKCFGLSLSDQYWVCPADSSLDWEKINFFDNPFSESMGNLLLGMPGDSEKEPVNLITPDNTSDGWLRKKWSIAADGRRILLKAGSGNNMQEPYNEVIASQLMEKLKIPHVNYGVAVMNGEPFSYCEDFITRDTELVSAFHISQILKKNNQDSPWDHYLKCMEALGMADGKLRLQQMVTVDYLIANTDRHYNNFGGVRNAESLEWIGFAPVYDSGTSLWHDVHENRIPKMEDCPSKPFRKTQEEQILLVDDFSWLELSALSDLEELVEAVLAESDYISESRRSVICRSVKKRAEKLKILVNEGVR